MSIQTQMRIMREENERQYADILELRKSLDSFRVQRETYESRLRQHIEQGSWALAEVDRLKRIVCGMAKLMVGDK